MLLAVAAAVPTCIAITSELAFACASRKGLFVRKGAFGRALRKAQRLVELQIPWLSGVAAAASIALALSEGISTRGGRLALGAALALGAHLALYAQVARRFQHETECLEHGSASGKDLAALQVRWDVEMTTRASLHAAALVCIVASALLG